MAERQLRAFVRDTHESSRLCVRRASTVPSSPFITFLPCPYLSPRTRLYSYICIRPLYPRGLPASISRPRRRFRLVNLLFWRMCKRRFRRADNTRMTVEPLVLATVRSRIQRENVGAARRFLLQSFARRRIEINAGYSAISIIDVPPSIAIPPSPPLPQEIYT